MEIRPIVITSNCCCYSGPTKVGNATPKKVVTEAFVFVVFMVASKLFHANSTEREQLLSTDGRKERKGWEGLSIFLD